MKSFVSVNEVNELCEALILDFMKSTKHICVDIEGFITEYLKLNIVYVPFAIEEIAKEGMLSDGVQGIWISKNKKKEYVQFSFFDDVEALEKERKIQSVVVELKKKYGKDAVLKV